MGKRVVLLSGGTALGAYQVGPLEKIRDQHWDDIDRIAGVSVGAVNGVMLAQDDLDELERVWEEVDGTRSFMKLSLRSIGIPGRRGAGLFSLSPLGRKLRLRVHPPRLKKRFSVGVCDFDADEYRDLEIEPQMQIEKAVQRILASSAQPFYMRGYRLDVGQRVKHHCYDGGVRHVIPNIDIDADVDAVDVLMTKPADRKDPWYRGKQANIFEIAFRGLRTYDDSVILSGLFRLLVLQSERPGLDVRIWAPDKLWYEANDPGPFKAASHVIQKRLAHGRTIEPMPLNQFAAQSLRACKLEPLAELVESGQFYQAMQQHFVPN